MRTTKLSGHRMLMNRRWAKAAIPNETSMRQTEDDASCAEGSLDMLQEYIRESRTCWVSVTPIHQLNRVWLDEFLKNSTIADLRSGIPYKVSLDNGNRFILIPIGRQSELGISWSSRPEHNSLYIIPILFCWFN